MQLVVPRAVSAAVRTEITIWMMTLHVSLFFMVIFSVFRGEGQGAGGYLARLLD